MRRHCANRHRRCCEFRLHDARGRLATAVLKILDALRRLNQTRRVSWAWSIRQRAHVSGPTRSNVKGVTIMKNITTVVLTLLCTACASMVDQAEEPREAREYRTGSNVPVRDRTAPGDVKTVDQSAI